MIEKLPAESQNVHNEPSLPSSYFSVRNFTVNRPTVNDFSAFAALKLPGEIRSALRIARGRALVWYNDRMEENPYQAPAQLEAVDGARKTKPITTATGCLLAIITGFAVGFALLYLIGLVRSLT